MSSKLSKRKQKALAFRGKKSKPDSADKDSESAQLEKAIPLEDGEEQEPKSLEQQTSSWLGKDIVKGTSTKSKRKRREDSPKDIETASKKSKTTPSSTKQKPPAAKRFIVFLGNLPHLPPAELTPLLNSHFPMPPKHIRVPTKKGSNAPQGYAFAEFDSSAALEKALRCHHTVLGGRKINVELTAGGGGKSEQRMGRIKGKNEILEEERRKRVEEERKEKEKGGKEVKGGIHPDRLKRIKGV
jgi:nucleolar protein 6